MCSTCVRHVAGNFSPACHAVGMFDNETSVGLLAALFVVVSIIEWLIVSFVIVLSIFVGPGFNACTVHFFRFSQQSLSRQIDACTSEDPSMVSFLMF